MSIEDLLGGLIAALDRNTAALGAQGAKSGKKSAKAETEATAQPGAVPASPASAPAATPAAPAEQPAPVTTLSGPTQKEVADIVIKLANEHSRDAAVSILAKQRGANAGVTRVSDLQAVHYQDVFNEANAAIAAAISAKANASLV
jgi:hypothetical protein